MEMPAKKVWSNDPETIQERMDYLREKQAPIILAQKGCENQTVYVNEIRQKKTISTVAFTKTREALYKKESCFFLYRPLEYLTHIFEGVPLLDSEQNITIVRPPVIFELSKRKYPRIATADKSRALYLLPFSSRLSKGQLKDISLDGAFMVGPYFSGLKEQLTIGPVELTLECNSAAIDSIKIHVPEATLMRVNKLEGNMAGIALHFELDGDNITKLAEYIRLRSMEVGATSGVQG